MRLDRSYYKKGFNIIELILVLSILSLLFTMAVPNFESHFKRIELYSTVRAITGLLNNARFKAIMLNNPVKFSVEKENDESKIYLREKRGNTWVKISEYNIEKYISATCNASPIFYPAGDVAPLCSVYVGNKITQYKISISIAGRIKVIEV